MTKSWTMMLVSQSWGGNLVGVFPREDSGHIFGFRRGEEDLSADQGPCEISPQNGNDQSDADEDGSPVSDHGFQHCRHRWLPHLRDLGPLQHGVGKHRHEHH